MYRSLMILVAANLVLTAQPPDLRKGTSGEPRIHALAGENASLSCPVKDNVDFVNWSKEDKTLEATNSRLKFTTKGTLKIQRVTERDAGRYRCTAINGFGAVSANVTLVVLGPLLEYDNGVERQNDFPDSGNVPASSVTGKPKFKEGYRKEASRLIQQTTERSVVFRCHPQGAPLPLVDWYKDGAPLREAEDRRIKIFRWKIELNHLKLSDAGVYSCVARNEHGFDSLNYTLRVTRPVLSKPEFVGHDPTNRTVFEGEVAIFQCRVRSTIKPHINWLKLVSDESAEQASQTRLIRFDGQFYQVLNSTEVLDHPDGSFLNKLNMGRTTLRDTGKYVCWAANTQGFIHSVAYLQVSRKPLTESASGSVTGNPFTVAIASSLTILTLLACAILMLRCINHPAVVEDTANTLPKHPPSPRKKLIRHSTDQSSSDHTRVKVHHHPKTQHHHYHQHSHRMGEIQY